MSQRLKNTLSFNLAAGASVVLPHGLVTSVGRPLAPDIVFAPNPSLTVTTTTAAVTLTNMGPLPLSGAVLVEAWHTIERSFADVNDEDLPVKPYVVYSGDAEPFPICTFVYRPGATGADAPGGNVFTDWNLLYAAIQATKKLGTRTVEFDDRFAPGGVAPIPPGTYNMTNVVWVGTSARSVTVTLEDGAIFVVDPPGSHDDVNLMRFKGPEMTIVGNRVNAANPAPFTDISIEVEGFIVQFIQNPDLGMTALPMFAVTPAAGAITLFFNTPRGGMGQFPVSLFFGSGPPLIDSGTDIVQIVAAAGLFANDILTGAGFADLDMLTGAAWGDVFTEFSNSAFTGVYSDTVAVQMVRNISYPPVDANITGGLPWDAFYNELVLVDPSQGPVTINLPNAQSKQSGERITVKVIGDISEGNEITIASAYGNSIEQPSITNNKGSKTWSMDGLGNWHLVASL
jgi:hypothetical protein